MPQAVKSEWAGGIAVLQRGFVIVNKVFEAVHSEVSFVIRRDKELSPARSYRKHIFKLRLDYVINRHITHKAAFALNRDNAAGYGGGCGLGIDTEAFVQAQRRITREKENSGIVIAAELVGFGNKAGKFFATPCAVNPAELAPPKIQLAVFWETVPRAWYLIMEKADCRKLGFDIGGRVRAPG